MKVRFMRMFRGLLAITVLSGVMACETVQTTQGGAVGVDRPQRMAISSAEIEQASAEQYSQVMAEARQKGVLNTNSAHVNRVKAIAARLIPTVATFRPDALRWAWETNILTVDEVNAWCMPGGKMAVYTGLIERLKVTDDELAAVMGHEMAHALREHARERASEQAGAGLAISAVAAIFGISSTGQKLGEYAYMGMVGLPNSRAHETEADRVGVELAARAGYDPRAAVTLWQKMAQVGGNAPIKFLSTHPTREDRLADLTAYSARVMPLYEQARKTR